MVNLTNIIKTIIKQGINHDERFKNRQWEEIREVVQRKGVVLKGESRNTLMFILEPQSGRQVEVMKNATFMSVYLWGSGFYEILEKTSVTTLSEALKEIENKLKKIKPKTKILTNEILLDAEKLENEIKEERWGKLKELIMKSKLEIKDINNTLITVQGKKLTKEVRIMFNTSSKGCFARIEYQKDGEILSETTVGTLFDTLTNINHCNL